MPSSVTSWLIGATVVALVAAGVIARDRFARFFFELEDARPIALFRIVLAGLLLLHVHGLAPYFELLFAPTGMFAPSAARETFGHFGACSLLFFDIPFEPVLALFDLFAVLLLVGVYTLTSAVATLVLFDSILTRNPVFWEGTDVVLRVWLVYLACARCGHAWSVDAWRHRRRTGDNSRLIPAWPRRLMTIQLALLMVTTGLLKHGGAWLEGDAAYLAMTSQFYARFDLADEIAALGDRVITALSWIARSIEVGFPLALVGVIGRWSATRDAPLRGRLRAAWVAAILVAFGCSTAVVAITGAPRLLPIASRTIAVMSWVLAGALVAWTWRELQSRAASPWIVDRRLWGGATAVLMLGLWAAMNIGQFHPVMLATLIPMLAAEPSDPAPLAYTSRTRAIGSAVLGWHLVALIIAAIPEATHTTALRRIVGTVGGPWLELTRTSQSWGMWADPPRDTVFLRVVIIDDLGHAHELRDDLYDDARLYRSSYTYDRWWKIAGRVASANPESPYPAAFVRWTCRQHANVRTVELWTTTMPILTPAQRREGTELPTPAPELRRTSACGPSP